MRWLFISSGGVLVRDILIASGSGVILGIIFYFLAVYQVSVRAQFTEKDVVKKIKNAKWLVVWIAILTTLYIIISFSNIDIWDKMMFGLIIAMALNISAVDIALRKIPNVLLLGMILLKIADFAIKHKYANTNGVQAFFLALVSMIAIYILCTLPSIVGISMGAGDIKYCSVLGFVFGIVNFALAMLTMSILLMLYWVYLKKTKKGNMKTSAPMGPFLSAGVMLIIATILF